MMRYILLGLTLAIALAGNAWAQGYEYQASGLEYQATTPVEAGETVTGLIRLPSGMTALGPVKVEDVYYDDLFAYWAGDYGGSLYFYDIYSGYWRPGPVGYEYANLNFQGENVEGWVRAFGNTVDYDNFFGRDGVLYKRINVTRNRTRNTNRHRQIVYTYFVNMATGARSDGEGLPYTVIGDTEVAAELIEEVMLARESQLANIVDEDPAYPHWEAQAFDLPAEVAAPETVHATDEANLLDLIEDEIGPLSVGEETTETDQKPATEVSTEPESTESAEAE